MDTAAVRARNVRFSDKPSEVINSMPSRSPIIVRTNSSSVDTEEQPSTSVKPQPRSPNDSSAKALAISEICDIEEYLPLDIFTAASVGDTNTCRLLMFNGGVNEKNKGGWTSLMYAAFFGRDDCVQLLLNRGAKVDGSNPKGQTALMLAASNGNCRAISILFEAGADCNAVDKRGWTALFYAVECNQSTAAETLLRQRCNVNHVERINSYTPLLLACRDGHELILDMLLRYGADIDVRASATLGGDGGGTAFELALQHEHPNLITLLQNKRREIDAALAPDIQRHTAVATVHTVINSDTCQKQSPTAKPQAAVEPLVALSDVGVASPPDNRAHALRQCNTIEEFLRLLDLVRLLPIFASQEVDFEQFLLLTDTDLKELGLKFGPKKKIVDAITKYHAHGRPTTVQQAESAYLAERQRAETAIRNSEQISIELSDVYESERQLKEELYEQRRVSNQLKAALQSVKRLAGVNRNDAHNALAAIRRISPGVPPSTKELIAAFSRVASNCDQQLLKAAECGCVGSG